MPTKNVPIPIELHARIKAIAATKGVSLQKVVVEALKKHEAADAKRKKA